MPLRPRFLAIAAALLLVPAVPCAAPEVGGRATTSPVSVRRAATFRFGGTVTEPGGRPVRDAKVVLQGLLEPAARTDAEGRFSFSYVVPDVQAIAPAPLRLVLRANRKGWNLALPTGESALAVELRLVRAADGSARLEVRSNDAGVAKAVAGSFGLPGDVEVALSGGFLRQLGAEDRSEPVLSALEIVPVAPPAPATRAATVAPPATATGAVPVAPPAPATRAATGTPPGARANPAAASAPRPDSAKTVSPVAGKAPVRSARPERPESMRLFPSAPEPGAKPGPAPASPSERRSRDAVPIPAAQEPRRPTPARRAPGTGAADTTMRPGIRVSVRPDTVAPGPMSAGSSGGGALRVALGRALPDTQPSASAGSACECQVKGTVEVSSDHSLRDALRVVVSLAKLPALRDTVTLDMGPPRPFDLGLVPCGPHRLDVLPLSSRRFTVAPRALAVFDCRAGRTQQFRVVLKPR